MPSTPASDPEPQETIHDNRSTITDWISAELIQQYHCSGPRYTSYPTVPTWESGAFGRDYARFLQIEGSKQQPISLYVHLPFCRQLCTFCGCNKFITTNFQMVNDYLEVLEHEIEAVTQQMGVRKSIQQLHFGGGTPTHLSPEQLERLFRVIEKHFDIASGAEIAIEVHPRVTTQTHLQTLYDLGFRRISLGVQDLDPAVQHAINRGQTLEQTQQCFYGARELGYEGINIDLVYGLPKQTQATFHQTMEEVHKMHPDRLAVYSFAYIPNMFRTHERAIKEEHLPSTEEKLAVYVDSIHYFLDHGYEMIGMDHYATPEDELTMAQREGTLHRNFMGYTTLKGITQIGLGVSAISDFGNGYFQNDKELQSYSEKIKAGQLSSIRKKELSDDDVLRREVIETLMCQCRLPIEELEKQYDVNFKGYFKEALPTLEQFAEEGLLTLDANALNLTDKGRLFMRNVAMPFDAYLNNDSSTPHFSKTI